MDHGGLLRSGVIGFFAAGTLDRLAIAPAAGLAVRAVAGSVFVLILIVAAWRLDAALSRRHRPIGDEDSLVAGQPRLGPRYLGPILWSALILTAFGLWLMGLEEVMWTVVILALVGPAIAAAHALVNHMFDRADMDAKSAAVPDPDMPDGAAVVDMPEAADAAQQGHHDLYRLIIDRLAASSW